MAEPRLIERALDFGTRLTSSGDGGAAKNGFYPELANMTTGAGWLSAGPGFRHWLAGDRVFVDASAAVSWRAYRMAQARIELPGLARRRLIVGSQARWQDLTQVTYFGEGADSLDAQRSEYRLRSTNVAGYGIVRPARWLSIGARAGWLGRPAIHTPAGSFRRGNPATQDVFPDDPVFALSEQPVYGYGEASIEADTRDHRGHPTQGAVYRAAWTAYSDRDAGTFSFRRTEVEAARFVPLGGARVVIAMRGWLAATDTSDGKHVPFYMQPSLGGSNTVRGYTDFRFHDRNMAVVNLESRIALFTHVDTAVFADAGNVAARLGDLNLAKRAYGFGVRVHTQRTTLARVDMAHGQDGWRFLFRTSDPLRLARLSRRTAAIPFVP